jgi:hypothetical protein
METFPLEKWFMTISPSGRNPWWILGFWSFPSRPRGSVHQIRRSSNAFRWLDPETKVFICKEKSFWNSVLKNSLNVQRQFIKIGLFYNCKPLVSWFESIKKLFTWRVFKTRAFSVAAKILQFRASAKAIKILSFPMV